MWACCAVFICAVSICACWSALRHVLHRAFFALCLFTLRRASLLKNPPGRGSCAKTSTCCIIVHRAREYPTNRLIVSTLAEGA